MWTYSAGKYPEELGIAQSVISRVWQRFEDGGNASRCYSTDRPEIQRRMRTSIWQLLPKKQTEHSIRPVSQLSSATRTTVSRQTVYRRLGHIGLYARRPVRCVSLTQLTVACD
ncbi:HTH_Tnp_Tc3_2 domain-containing protein [Trichonephila clavipes]|nr:HTH_Tnp_Tc3_2 domain-containing protein [Trichonephila clavipes]